MSLYLDYYNYKFGCQSYNLSVMHGVTALGLSLPWIYTEGADLTLMRYYRYHFKIMKVMISLKHLFFKQVELLAYMNWVNVIKKYGNITPWIIAMYYPIIY